MKTRASVMGHPVHMGLAHFPVAFLIGAFAAPFIRPSSWATSLRGGNPSHWTCHSFRFQE
jgi:hypothetical protein